MQTRSANRTQREERLVRRMVARGEAGLAEALCALKGVTFGRRYVFRSLYAIGGEGAVFDVDDTQAPRAVPLVGKVALHPVHQPFELTADGIRERRLALRRESVILATCGGDSMPADVGHYQFANPALDAGRGGAFGEAEPVLLMEKLPGLDLDRWLARVHRAGVPLTRMTESLDRFAVGLLRGIDDLASRGFLFADLRPGNIRVLPTPFRHIRLLDAGSIVREHEVGERFPHVPGYLPPAYFHDAAAGKPIRMSHEVMAEMAGRALFEIATGEPPYPGEAVDLALLDDAPVSAAVSNVVRALVTGELQGVGAALEHVADVVDRVVPDLRVSESASSDVAAAGGGQDGGDWCPADFMFQGDVAMPSAPERPLQPAPAEFAAAAVAAPTTNPDPPPATRSWLRRLFDRVFRA
jgi:hypothetical protein